MSGWEGGMALSQELTPLPHSVAVPVGLLVFIAFASEGIWRLARHISVIAHEGAHAAAGWIVGCRVRGVILNRNATGATTTEGPNSGVGWIITGFAGYLGPSVCGLVAAELITQHDIVAVLWVAIVFLAIILLLIRNSFGIISVILNGGLLVLVLHYGNAELQTVAAYGLSWFMLLSGVRWVLIHNIKAGDARILLDGTRIPRIVWFALWLAATVTALWLGGRLLLG
jgi:hypothetical protein